MSSLLVADEGMAEKTDEVAVVRALGEGQGLRIGNVDLVNFINIIGTGFLSVGCLATQIWNFNISGCDYRNIVIGFTLTYLRYVSNSLGMLVQRRDVGVSSFLWPMILYLKISCLVLSNLLMETKLLIVNQTSL